MLKKIVIYHQRYHCVTHQPRRRMGSANSTVKKNSQFNSNSNPNKDSDANPPQPICDQECNQFLGSFKYLWQTRDIRSEIDQQLTLNRCLPPSPETQCVMSPDISFISPFYQQMLVADYHRQGYKVDNIINRWPSGGPFDRYSRSLVICKKVSE